MLPIATRVHDGPNVTVEETLALLVPTMRRLGVISAALDADGNLTSIALGPEPPPRASPPTEPIAPSDDAVAEGRKPLFPGDPASGISDRLLYGAVG